MIEWIQILKLLWTQDEASFAGEYYRFSGITIAPKPLAKPHPPVWMANDPTGDREKIARTHRRVVRHADGWQTGLPARYDLAWRLEDIRQQAREIGRDPGEIETSNYHNININEDRDAALAESKRFLDTYYSADFAMDYVDAWTATGSPEQCIEHLREYERLGFDEVTLRPTSWDQMGQLQRMMEEVLPHLAERDGRRARSSAPPS